MIRPDTCPKCGADFDAGDIFTVLRSQSWCNHMSDAELRQHVIDCYGGPGKRFSRVIWITTRPPRIWMNKSESEMGYWMCPDCGAMI